MKLAVGLPAVVGRLLVQFLQLGAWYSRGATHALSYRSSAVKLMERLREPIPFRLGSKDLTYFSFVKPLFSSQQMSLLLPLSHSSM